MRTLKTFLLLQAIVLFFTFLNFIPYLQQLNNLFVDQLHGSLSARPEISVVAIDDKSLQSIGAWPWDRSVFAKVIDQLNAGGAKVVGIDVIFAEARSGDEVLSQSLTKSQAQVVFVNKYDFESKQLVNSLFTDNQGIANYPDDLDGKTRRAFLPETEIIGDSTPFPFKILMDYSSPDFVLDKLPKNTFNNTILFNYTLNVFPTVSIVDVYEGKTTPDQFKDKIVLIGVTTEDFKNNLNDNLIDIFGQSTPGVIIHANVINSFLHNRFQHTLPFYLVVPLAILLSSIIYILSMKIRNNLFGFITLIVSCAVVTVTGFVFFEYGINWPFLTLNIVLVVTYIFSVVIKYMQISQQRQFIQQAFEQYINPSLLKKIIDNPEKLMLGGEKKPMTVMFSDVRGFTTLSEKIEPEELVHLLNDYLDEMCEIVIDNKGTIDKFIGDAIMAFWNAPLDDDGHRENAIKTGLEMVERLDHFNSKHSNVDPLHIGIGMHTGDMVVGNVGSRKRFDYTVLGDNVNLASRIEGLTKKYGITFLVTKEVITGGLHQDTASELLFRHIDTAIVKGKSKPIILFQPLYKTPENEHLKEVYEKAWDAYAKSEFSTARKLWSQLSDDPTSQIMLERLNEVQEYKEWNGVWEWKEK